MSPHVQRGCPPIATVLRGVGVQRIGIVEFKPERAKHTPETIPRAALAQIPEQDRAERLDSSDAAPQTSSTAMPRAQPNRSAVDLTVRQAAWADVRLWIAERAMERARCAEQAA